VDAAGDLYIADSNNCRVRKVDSTGTITTVAGNGSTGYSGDGGPGTGATLTNPEGVAVSPAGDLYITDAGNLRVRKLSAAGTITTVIGGGLNDGGFGVFGLLNQPAAAVRDGAGNTYIVDSRNHRVRKVAANGIITTLAGTGAPGFSGDGGAASSAQLSGPEGVAADSSGNVYVADSGNFRIRKVDTTGVITTVAGTGSSGYAGDGGAATDALVSPYGLVVDSAGNLYATDIYNHVVRKVTPSGTITTVAGNGQSGYAGDGGAATSASLNQPNAVAVDAAGNLYVADEENLRIRKIDTSGVMTTVAGNGQCCYSGDGGAATNAQLCYPTGVTADASGDLFIADSCSARVREVFSSGGTITTVAGNGNYGYAGDGYLAIGATLTPYAVSADSAGNVVIVDSTNNIVRLLTPPGLGPVLTLQSTHAGSFSQGQTTATYSLTVSNSAGAGPTRGTVTVTESLPAGLTLVGMDGSGWTCSAPQAPACTRSDGLGGGSAYPPITVTASVSATAPAQVTNQAGVSGGGGNIAGAQDLTAIAPASSRERRICRSRCGQHETAPQTQTCALALSCRN